MWWLEWLHFCDLSDGSGVDDDDDHDEEWDDDDHDDEDPFFTSVSVKKNPSISLDKLQQWSAT